MNISAAYYSSIGNRGKNDDNISLLENRDNIIAIVADGLGGESDGGIASLTTIQTINARLSGSRSTAEHIEKAIANTNDEIIKLQDNGRRMKSTVAILCICKAKAIAATVGDTRIYQFRRNKVIYQSTDHSVSQMSVSVGEINIDEIRGHVDRNRLTRALGSKNTVEVDTTELVSIAGDAFLLCSDGFWEHVRESEMSEDLSLSNNADEWLSKMRKRVETRISPTGDNHSAIAIINIAKQEEDLEHEQ